MTMSDKGFETISADELEYVVGGSIRGPVIRHLQNAARALGDKLTVPLGPYYPPDPNKQFV
jgi:hypothetical protein